jgi:hypothetical protein
MALNFADLNLMSLKVMVESGCWNRNELLEQIDRMANDIKKLQTEKEGK